LLIFLRPDRVLEFSSISFDRPGPKWREPLQSLSFWEQSSSSKKALTNSKENNVADPPFVQHKVHHNIISAPHDSLWPILWRFGIFWSSQFDQAKSKIIGNHYSFLATLEIADADPALPWQIPKTNVK
jgi:hypothetical protein